MTDDLLRRISKTAQAFVVARRGRQKTVDVAVERYRDLAKLVDQLVESDAEAADLDARIAHAGKVYVAARRGGVPMVDEAWRRYGALEILVDQALRLARPFAAERRRISTPAAEVEERRRFYWEDRD